MPSSEIDTQAGRPRSLRGKLARALAVAAVGLAMICALGLLAYGAHQVELHYLRLYQADLQQIGITLDPTATGAPPTTVAPPSPPTR